MLPVCLSSVKPWVGYAIPLLCVRKTFCIKYLKKSPTVRSKRSRCSASFWLSLPFKLSRRIRDGFRQEGGKPRPVPLAPRVAQKARPCRERMGTDSIVCPRLIPLVLPILMSMRDSARASTRRKSSRTPPPPSARPGPFLLHDDFKEQATQ
jgi:hypothetical protein